VATGDVIVGPRHIVEVYVHVRSGAVGLDVAERELRPCDR
jgi:hypothetical protein